MARLYADEQFPYSIIELLRNLEHDVLTVQEANNRGQSDADVLAFAISMEPIVLTFNRRHFIRLHQQQPNHMGIIVCTDDPDREQLAARIHAALTSSELCNGKLIRINRET